MGVCKPGTGAGCRAARAPRWLWIGLGSVMVLGCGGGEDTGAGSAGNRSGSGKCREIPEEAPGEHPDVQSLITQDAYYRSDITEGQPGTPLTLQLTLMHADADCAPLAGANVEVWHADARGVYSEYATAGNAGSTATMYLRGIQSADNAGRVTFRTIYPGWYAPRAAHVHVRIYRDLHLRKTTQIGFPDATSDAVYAATNLYGKGPNPTKNASDSVFGANSGGSATQIASVTGDNGNGYVASLTLAISDYSID
jgi:protocatechuate 3,4-dioxygenase beta subunit